MDSSDDFVKKESEVGLTVEQSDILIKIMAKIDGDENAAIAYLLEKEKHGLFKPQIGIEDLPTDTPTEIPPINDVPKEVPPSLQEIISEPTPVPAIEPILDTDPIVTDQTQNMPQSEEEYLAERTRLLNERQANDPVLQEIAPDPTPQNHYPVQEIIPPNPLNPPESKQQASTDLPKGWWMFALVFLGIVFGAIGLSVYNRKRQEIANAQAAEEAKRVARIKEEAKAQIRIQQEQERQAKAAEDARIKEAVAQQLAKKAAEEATQQAYSEKEQRKLEKQQRKAAKKNKQKEAVSDTDYNDDKNDNNNLSIPEMNI